MGAITQFTWDSRDLAMWRNNATEKALARAFSSCGGKALKVMQDASIKHVVSRKNLKEADVRDGLPLIKPSRKEVLREMQWAEDVSGEPMPLSRFPFFQSAHGITVAVNRGSTTAIKSAFAAKMSSGHLGIFKRSGKFGRNENPKLEKIQELWTSRISDVMQDAGAIPEVQTAAHSAFAKAFEKAIVREMKKMRKSGDL